MGQHRPGGHGQGLKGRFGGQAARRWRRSIAKLATAAADERTFTLKFPLDLQGRTVDFGLAAAQYNVVEGTRPGSLLAFVTGLHLAGFRLFTSRAEAATFRQKSAVDDDAFRSAALESLGVETEGLSAEAIVNFLSAKPRKGLNVYGRDDLARRLYFKFVGKRLDDKADAGLAEFCNGLAGALTERFATWDALYTERCEAVEAANAYLQGLSTRFPSLMPMVNGSSAGPVVEAPIAWSGPVDPALADTDTTLWLHLCVARYLPASGAAVGAASRMAPAVQNMILSAQDNGLSWLFNKGLDYFRSTPARVVCDEHGVPESSAWAVERLGVLASAIPLPAFNRLSHYADFRKTFAGKQRSWVANYLSRLDELAVLFSQGATQVAAVPDCFDAAHQDAVFNGLDDEVEAWLASLAQAPAAYSQAVTSLQRLRGEHAGLDAEDVRRIEDVSRALDYASGFEKMLLARIEQRQGEIAGKPYGSALLRWAQQRQEAILRIPRLTRISGELPDLADEARRRSSLLQGLLNLQRIWAQRLAALVGRSMGDLLAALAENEGRGLARHPRAQEWLQQPERLHELAARRFLASVAGLARRLSPPGRDHLVVLLRQWNVVTEKRLFNGWVINRRGSIYRSPWSTARHEPLPIRSRCWEGANWLEDLTRLFQDPTHSGDVKSLGDWLQVQQFLLRSRVACLTADQPASLLDGMDLAVLSLAPPLRLGLSRALIAFPDLRRLTGLLQGEVTRITQDCLRTDLMVRAKVQFIDSNELLYVPKQRDWRIPERYRGEGASLARVLAAAQAGEVESAVALAGRLFPRRRQGDLDGAAGQVLRQVPHDWYLPSRLTDQAFPEAWLQTGMAIGKGRTSALPGRSTPVLGRLVGVSSFKSVLDRVLLDDRTRFGEVMLIVDQHFDQMLSVRDGSFSVDFTPGRQKLSAAVPITTADEPVISPDATPFFDRLVSIDLGERRIGFAVFDLRAYLERRHLDPVQDDSGQLAVGSVAVPSVRRLIQTVSGYRKVEQASQKIGDRYSRRLEQYRENVTADVCHAIDELCARYGGFPVLESSVRNFEQGARQLDLVYKAVLNRYSFSNVDAHKAVRKQYWFGSDKWLHPYAKVYEWDEAGKTYRNRPKDFHLFPGATISPAGTSQTCWKCGRNPLTALRDLGAQVRVEPDGVVWTEAGNMRLLRGREYSEADLRRSRQQQVNLRMNRPLEAGAWPAKEAERFLRMTMRQPQISRRARDTTQSLYQCVFTDCGSTHHADEGAAVNIGRKFLREKVAVGQTPGVTRD